MQEGAVTPGCPLPRCHCPCALCCPCPAGPTPQPRTTKCPLERPPCPAPCVSIRTFPRHRLLEMVIPGLAASSNQFGPMSSAGSGLQQLRGLQTRPQMSPCWEGVTGNAKPSREQLCPHPCASSLDILCPLAAGAGDCSPCPLPSLCHLPLGPELFVPLPRHRGAAGWLEALQEGSAVSSGSPRRNFHLRGMGATSRHKHFPPR